MINRRWNKEDKEKLFKMWEEGVPKEEIESTFPDRTYVALKRMCQKAGIKKGLRGRPQEPFKETDINPHYICGFVDGEGCFRVSFTNTENKRQLVLSFTIKLRDDDSEILYDIRNYFKCGKIYNCYTKQTKYSNRSKETKPQIEYQVFRNEDIEQIIIPFFEEYPLRAKKRRDFIVWKELFELKKQLTMSTNNADLWVLIEEKVKELRAIREYR